jgi:tetraacyldisaccharide 4'-kinase
MLKPLVPVYSGALAVKERLLERGWMRQRRLRHPVISVGSLSAGGAGKTPVVVMLAELLGARGYEVRILTRGYGRRGGGLERVALDAFATGDAGRFGDEPVMMARRLPDAAVWVGADRLGAGRLSEKGERDSAKVVYLLDDGFQHRGLVRDIDVVLLTRQELSDSLMPMGNLREPLRAIRRADVVVLREDEGFAGGISGKAATWFVRRELRFPAGGELPKRAVAFCGVARPEGFFAMLAKAGVEVAEMSVFRDHHAYSIADVEGLVELAKAHGVDGFVTTEKDAVKLSAEMRVRLGAVTVAELRVRLVDEKAAMDGLLETLAARRKDAPI